jgi:hypothetical protein
VICWSNTAATKPFPGIGFQITTETNSTDDLPCNEQNRLIQYAQNIVEIQGNATMPVAVAKHHTGASEFDYRFLTSAAEQISVAEGYDKRTVAKVDLPVINAIR